VVRGQGRGGKVILKEFNAMSFCQGVVATTRCAVNPRYVTSIEEEPVRGLPHPCTMIEYEGNNGGHRAIHVNMDLSEVRTFLLAEEP
jgi:hypothetical protein